jgi:hypothetical protein
MKLNKFHKQAIVRSIMADVPKVDKDKRRAAIQAEVVKLMSPAVRKIYNTIPSALRKQHVGDLIYNGTNWNERDIIAGDVAEKDIIAGDVAEKDIKAICEPYKAEDETRYKAERSLAGVVEACSTLKQLKERLPEFTKYYPTEEAPTANLPALANVVADLSKLGWPKGAK